MGCVGNTGGFCQKLLSTDCKYLLGFSALSFVGTVSTTETAFASL